MAHLLFVRLKTGTNKIFKPVEGTPVKFLLVKYCVCIGDVTGFSGMDALDYSVELVFFTQCSLYCHAVVMYMLRNIPVETELNLLCSLLLVLR